MPDSADAMTWHIGDHGFRMTLSPRVPELIKVHLQEWLRGWLGRHGLALEDVESWAVHPGGPRILLAVEHALELPSDALQASWETLRDYGNMSSPTILFILDRLRREGAATPCVALAFGPGLTVEAALFTGAGP
jgi:predicted naringenin-chalcone synthase